MSALDATRREIWGFRLLKWIGWVVVVLAAAAVVFRVTFSAIPENKARPSWASSSGVPTPPNFLYAMFPADGAVPLCDSPGGKPVATLARAVVNSQEEIDSGGWVRVREPRSLYAVQLSRLDYLPAPDASGDAFASFAAAYQAAEPGTYRAASFQLQRSDSGITTAKLRLRQEDHWQEYVYEVSPGKATPREMYLGFGPAEAFGDIGRFLAAVSAAGGFLDFVGAGWLVVVLRGHAARRQRPTRKGVGEATET